MPLDDPPVSLPSDPSRISTLARCPTFTAHYLVPHLRSPGQFVATLLKRSWGVLVAEIVVHTCPNACRR